MIGLLNILLWSPPKEFSGPGDAADGISGFWAIPILSIFIYLFLRVRTEIKKSKQK